MRSKGYEDMLLLEKNDNLRFWAKGQKRHGLLLWTLEKEQLGLSFRLFNL